MELQEIQVDLREDIRIPPSLKTYFEEEGFEKYKQVRYLIEVENPKDPETDPFRSMYKARACLEDILQKVRKEREDNESDPFIRMMDAALHYHLGVNYIHTEERPTGEEYLKKSIQLLKEDLYLQPEVIGIALSARSELGILWSSRTQGSNEAFENLDEAEKMYETYKHNVGSAPLGIHELFKSEEAQMTEFQRNASFEKIYTYILFYLAQIHKTLGNTDESASYCQRTLRRQLDSKEYDPKEWALNAACLSQYFISKDMFRQAKHCLSCAKVISGDMKVPEDLPPPSNDEDEETRKKREAIPQTLADIARCWVKYCISLLEISKERLLNEIGDLDVNRQYKAIAEGLITDQSNNDVPKDQERMPLEVDAVEETVRHAPVVTFEQGRELFVLGKSYVDSALDFFVMDGYVTDNVELHQDLSTLYKHMLFFETSKEVKCRMHKRRIDLLKAVLEELNPQFYLLICRQLQFELGEIYSEMLDLKIAICSASAGNPTDHAIKKMNSLCKSGIHCFSEFLNTLKNLKKVYPERFDPDVERPAIVAMFYMARLNSKVIAPVKSEKLKYMQNSLDFYKWITDYGDRNPECESVVEKELEICREMVVLFPKSMERYME